MAARFTFGKTERLKSRKQIDELFAGGKSFAVFPLRVSYNFFPARPGMTVQAGVTASKRNYKRAVDRNRIKRLLREAYRLNKEELLNAVGEKNLGAAVFFLYTDKTIASFGVIEAAMKTCLKKLQQKIPATHENPA
jgi:ribonuclease P protein component